MPAYAPPFLFLNRHSYNAFCRPKSEWSGYGSELASQEQDGGNPYAKGWSKLKMNAGVEGIYQQINQNLEPLAEQYPYMRAIRH
jgi:hypothetical protein